MIDVPLSIPTCVAIRNVRLKACYYVFLVPLIVALVWRFFRLKPYISVIDVSDGLTVSLDVEPLPADVLAPNATNANLSMCTSSASYHYMIDRHDGIEPTGCLHTCELTNSIDAATGLEHPCEPSASLSKQSLNGVFVTTVRNSRYTTSEGNVTTSELFSPFAANVTIKLSYSMRFELPATMLTKRQIVEGLQFNNILTVVVQMQQHSRAGIVRDVVLPGEDLAFSVHKALELAGLPADWLDVPNVDMQSDVLLRHPRGRVIGGRIELRVSCVRNPKSLNLQNRFRVDYVWNSGIHTAICVVSFYKVPGLRGMETFVDSLNPMTGGYRRVRDIGISFEIDGHVTCEILDLNGFMLYLTSAVVILGVPKFLIVFLMTYCLGNLSVIFKRVIARPFCIESDVAGVATRAVTRAQALTTLEESPHSMTLPEAKFKGELSRVLRTRKEFSVAETETVVNFVYRSFFKVNQVARQSQMFFSSPSNAVEVLDHVSFDQLGQATSSNEPVDVSSIVKLFDIDRRRGFLERVFMPPAVSKALHERREATYSVEEEKTTAVAAEDYGARVLPEPSDLADSPFVVAKIKSTDSFLNHSREQTARARSKLAADVKESVPIGRNDAAEAKPGNSTLPIELSAVTPSGEALQEGKSTQDAIILARLELLAGVVHHLQKRVTKLEKNLQGSSPPVVSTSRLKRKTETATVAVMTEKLTEVDLWSVTHAAANVATSSTFVELSETHGGAESNRDGLFSADPFSVGCSSLPSDAGVSLRFPEASGVSNRHLSSAIVSLEKQLLSFQEPTAPVAPHPILPVTSLSDLRLQTPEMLQERSSLLMEFKKECVHPPVEGDGQEEPLARPAVAKEREVGSTDAQECSLAQIRTLPTQLQASFRPAKAEMWRWQGTDNFRRI